MFTMSVVYWSTVVVLLICYGIAESGLPCTLYRGECKAHVERTSESNQTTLEVSCQCKYKKDVSSNLNALVPMLCPEVPNERDSPLIDATYLRIQNCDIKDEPFPVPLLRVLRRAKYFRILIQDVDVLSLIPDARYEPHQKLTVEALIFNSSIEAISRGWFSGAWKMSLEAKGSRIKEIQPEFVSGTVMADIEFVQSEIKTIRSFGLMLPASGDILIKDCLVDLIETRAIEGGDSVSLVDSHIKSVKRSAFNINRINQFAIKGCSVDRIENNAFIMERNHLGNVASPSEVQTKVEISDNKFNYAEGGSFASFCQVKNITFKGNQIKEMDSPLHLKSAHCGVDRDWWTSVSNNGFSCDRCESFTGRINEQVCAVYETGWCSCTDASDDDERNFSFCKESVQQYVSRVCGPDVAQFFSSCKSFDDTAKSFKFEGRSVGRGSKTFVFELSIILLILSICVHLINIY